MIGIVRSGYNFSVQNFEGPLDLLLELIQGSKLKVTDISLSDITDQYLLYLKTMQLFNIDVASEFFVIAATLVFIKTKRLLPNMKQDEEEFIDEKELMERLKEYKKFKFIARYLLDKKEEGDIYFSRGYVSNPIPSVKVADPENLMIGDLLQVLTRYKGSFIRKAIPIKRREVNVEEKMTAILNHLSTKRMIKFSELIENEKTKVDKVASFLGSLELSFRQRVLLKQLALFRDIDIMKREEGLL